MYSFKSLNTISINRTSQNNVDSSENTATQDEVLVNKVESMPQEQLKELERSRSLNCIAHVYDGFTPIGEGTYSVVYKAYNKFDAIKNYRTS